MQISHRNQQNIYFFVSFIKLSSILSVMIEFQAHQNKLMPGGIFRDKSCLFQSCKKCKTILRAQQLDLKPSSPELPSSLQKRLIDFYKIQKKINNVQGGKRPQPPSPSTASTTNVSGKLHIQLQNIIDFGLLCQIS